MPRIRAIHPRAPQDEDVASMSIWARHLWDRLPCFADREGRLEDRPLMLKGEVFPADAVNVNEMLDEFAARGFIIRYTSTAGRRLIQIVSFHDYQRPDRKERDSVLEPPPGWTGDKRGKWVCDKTQGSAAGNAVDGGNDPGGLADSDDESGTPPEAFSAESPVDRLRARSGDPVIRLSGDPDSLTARDPSATVPAREMTGTDLCHMFGRLRREILELQCPPGAELPRDPYGKAQAFVESLDPAERADIEATMRLFLRHLKAGDDGWPVDQAGNGSMSFGSWRSRFGDLRAELAGAAPVVAKRSRHAVSPGIGRGVPTTEEPTVTGRVPMP